MTIRQLNLFEALLLEIFISLFLQSQLADSRERIGHIDTQHVLMAVHRHDGHLRGIARRLDAGDIAISVERHVDLASLMRLDIIAVHTDLRVHLSRHRILIGIVARIFRILTVLGIQSLEDLHGILLHSALVITDPDNLFGICREDHRTVGREFLLVHPVGNTVEHLIELAVGSYLTLCIVIKQLDEPDVIIPDKGYLIAVWRENGCLLRTTVTQRLQLVVPDTIYIIGGSERTAIDGLRLGLYQHPSAIGTHDIVVHPVDLCPSGCGGIEQDTYLLAGTERADFYPFTVIADLSVGLTIGHRTHFLHCLGAEITVGNTLQAEFLSCEGQGTTPYNQYRQDG